MKMLHANSSWLKRAIFFIFNENWEEISVTLAQYRELKSAVQDLLESLPKCEVCGKDIATHAYSHSKAHWCVDHAPVDCPPGPQADHLWKLQDLLEG